MRCEPVDGLLAIANCSHLMTNLLEGYLCCFTNVVVVFHNQKRMHDR